MIKIIEPSEFAQAAKVICDSFATVAHDLGFTERSFPTYTGFVTTAERLQTHADLGWLMYGLYENGTLIGYISILKIKDADDSYELHNLAVLPDHRHRGYGKQLLDFCVVKVKQLGGIKINISIIRINVMNTIFINLRKT